MKKLCDDSVVIIMEAAKGMIENGVRVHRDCASLVVVSGGMVFPSEYEGQTTC